MTELEFSALLRLEDKVLHVDESWFRGDRGSSYKLKKYYAVSIDDGQSGNWYRSRNYAVKKLAKEYYADNK